MIHNCEKYQFEISESLDTLTAPSGELLEHLQTCDLCQEFKMNWLDETASGSLDRLASQPREAVFSEERVESIMKRLPVNVVNGAEVRNDLITEGLHGEASASASVEEIEEIEETAKSEQSSPEIFWIRAAAGVSALAALLIALVYLALDQTGKVNTADRPDETIVKSDGADSPAALVDPTQPVIVENLDLSITQLFDATQYQETIEVKVIDRGTETVNNIGVNLWRTAETDLKKVSKLLQMANDSFSEPKQGNQG